MKNQFRRLTGVKTMTALLILATSSCQHIEEAMQDDSENGLKELEIEVLAQRSGTRGPVHGTSLPSGSTIAVMTEDMTVPCPYTSSGTGNGQVWSPDEKAVMAGNEDKAIYSVYPYAVPADGKVTVDNTNDWMYATPVTVNNRKSKAQLTMNHALSVVRLEVKKGTYSGNGEVTDLSFSSDACATSARMDIITGELTSIGGANSRIELAGQTFTLTESFRAFEALTIPAGNGNMTINVTVDGNQYRKDTEIIEIVAGKATRIGVVINDSEIDIQAATLIPWADEDNGEQTILADNHKIRITGNTDGIAFKAIRNIDESITITAYPVKETMQIGTVTKTGTATFNESTDNYSFINTITISDMQSDVELNYSGTTNHNWITCVYDVTGTGTATTLLAETSTNRPWTACRNAFKRMLIDGQEATPAASHTFATTGEHTVTFLTDNTLTTTLGMFDKCHQLTKITDSNKKFTKNVTDVRAMFQDCTGLTDITGLKEWTTEHLTSLQSIFIDCEKLQDITPLSNWKTGNVTNTSYMFKNCGQLKDITPVTYWDVSNVKTFEQMFALYNNTVFELSIKDGIEDLSALKNWDTSNAENMEGMFMGLDIKNLNGLEGWNTSKVTNMNAVFSYCNQLTDITAVKNWNTSNVEEMAFLFSTWGNDMNPMPTETDHIKDITPLADWNVSKVKDFSCMFQCQTEITNLDALTNWKTESAEDIHSMFLLCENLSDAAGTADWNMTKVKTTEKIFEGTRLTELDIQNWDLTSLTSSANMFKEITTTGTLYYDKTKENHDMIVAVKPPTWNTNHDQWARIQHVNGKLYTAEQWLAAKAAGSVTDADANGIAVKNNEYVDCPHVYYMEIFSNTYDDILSPKFVNVTGLHTSEPSILAAHTDGKKYTDDLIKDTEAGNLNAIIAQNCTNITFPDGSKGYLPSIGELMALFVNYDQFILCAEAINKEDLFQNSYIELASSSIYRMEMADEYYPHYIEIVRRTDGTDTPSYEFGTGNTAIRNWDGGTCYIPVTDFTYDPADEM